MSIHPSDVDRLERGVTRSLRDNWHFLLIEGVILVVLGAIAVIIPPIATLAVGLIVGWLFLISGLVGLVMTFLMRQAPGFWWSLLSAVLGIAVGVALIGWPAGGVLSLTLLLVVFFIMEGVATIMYALDHKRELPGRWGFMLASGIVDLALATIIYAGLPGTAAWAIGLMAGINLLFGGFALIGLALHARNLAV
jgi:uncharacterized membrane protein HdeD (DUF308 family)